MLNLVLFGPPGAGKGTQAAKIVEKYNLIHLSTGDILRGEIANKTELGLEAKKLMDKGELVPDEVVIGMIKNKVSSNTDAQGFIFDGFPRTTPQAEALSELMESLNNPISAMITLEVDKDELVQRLLKRGEETGRSDDNLETITNRIGVYEKQTAPAIAFYEKEGKYNPINGVGSVDEIFGRICEVLDKFA